MYLTVVGYKIKSGSLNLNDPCSLTGSDTVRKCDFVGVDMTLLEEASHCRGGL